MEKYMSRTRFWSDVGWLKTPTNQGLLNFEEKVALDTAIRDMGASSILTNAVTAQELVSHLVKVVGERLLAAKHVMISRTKLGFSYGR
jgi:nitrogen regulatory protein PII-like uncharacterized protein